MTLATKAELKPEQDKFLKFQPFDSSYFQGKIFFGDDGFQNTFVYQPVSNTTRLLGIQ